jgi:hypothetical protein
MHGISMTSVAVHAEFLLQAGGTLVPGRDLYIERSEDRELLQLLRRGQYVNVLTSRQMGKSSLMVRTMGALRDDGIHTAAIDLAAELAGATTAEQWFRGLLNRLQRDLGLSLEIAPFWSAYPNDTSGQKLQRFFRDVVCSAISKPIVVFLVKLITHLSLILLMLCLLHCVACITSALVAAYGRVTFACSGSPRPTSWLKTAALRLTMSARHWSSEASTRFAITLGH